MRRFRGGITALMFLVPGLAGGWMLHANLPESGSRVFEQVLQIVGRDAIEELTTDEAYYHAARGLVERLGDEYAELYSPEELATFSREQLGSNYGGLGMQIEDQQGLVTVTRVFPNTPAERGGVRAGDRILYVDGESTQGLKLEEVSGRLIGVAGTTVDVAFGRAGMDEPIRGTFTRAVVHIPAVPYAMVLDDGIGYIPLQRFNEGAARDVHDAVRKLQADGATSFVLDVRGNTGGSLEEALMISNLFLRAGQEIARVEYRNRPADVYPARNATILPDAPMVVLSDGFSASASEIVAGALQDHDRALVIGTSSFGKGLVQQIYPLDGGWAMKLTTGKWYTPVGRSIQRERGDNGVPIEDDNTEKPVYQSAGGRVIYGGGGITPDVLIRPDTMDQAEQRFMRAVGADQQKVYVAVYDLALTVKDDVATDFNISPAWRDQLFSRLQDAELEISRAQFDEARPLIDRLLEQRIAGLAFGDSAGFRRFAPWDAQLRAASELLRQGSTQRELFVAAERMNAARRSD
ncbi:MAG TPA: S41 family peptidase [Longimicrobiales bacterium]|nr:S41 family peptidase [Longimicrobiales bacterium]